MKRERRKRPGLPPAAVQIVVVERQLVRHMVGPSHLWRRDGDSDGTYLARLLSLLSGCIGCEVADLQLDHDPMLRVRLYRPLDGKPVADWYVPHAHAVDFLVWRSKRPQDAGSHAIKTTVRGEHGQLSDVALAKRERRREKNPDKWKGLRGPKKPKGRHPANASRTQKRSSQLKRIPSRPIRSRGFPPPGSRPFNHKRKRDA